MPHLKSVRLKIIDIDNEQMKNKSQIASSQIIIIESDTTFDFLKGKTLFPEKVAKAKEKLKSIVLPPK